MSQQSTRHDLGMQLIEAARSGNISRVQELLQSGADIHANDNRALRLASFNGHLEVVRLLLDSGANIHAQDDYALRLACWGGHVEVAQLLLEKGAYIHADDDFALRMAALNGHVEVIALLFNQDRDYFGTLIEQDGTLSEDSSLRALSNHYRLGAHLQSNVTPKLRHSM